MEAELLFTAGAALVTGAFGILVLAGSPQRAANAFLAAFLFLLAGNQFAEAMRALAAGLAGELFWFRIASVFAFLDPLALYCFGSVFPARNKLYSPRRLATVTLFSSSLALLAPFLSLDWRMPGFSGSLITVWTVGTVIIYTVVLREALSHVQQDPSSSSAALVPALCALAVPAATRAVYQLRGIYDQDGAGVFVLAALAALAVFLCLLREAGKIPASEPSARRSVLLGAWGGLALALVATPVLHWGETVGLLTTPSWLNTLNGASTGIKLLAFATLASTAILRQRMLDLSLGTRRWAARVLVGGFLVAGIVAMAGISVQASGGSRLADPALLAVLVVVLVATQGFRRFVDTVAEKAYGVPRDSEQGAKIKAYRAAVRQAHEEGRPIGTDPRLRRLRRELELDLETASVIERMEPGESDRGGPLVPGQRVDGRYRVERFLGRGGSGRAFLAEDELLDRSVAIKELLHGGAHETGRTLREARIAGQLDHPNVVTVHDVVQRPGCSLVVTEHAEGGSLADRLEEEGPMDARRAYALLDGILSGLEAVHDQGVVHGDLKPSNVLLDAQGTPKIADFGASRIGGGGTQAMTDVPDGGTPAYMAPEQREGDPPTEASDVHALGVLAAGIWREPLSNEVAEVLERARAQDSADRYASVTEMREALREARRSTVTSGR